MKIENVIFKMLTENTGAALCDSGGAYGRNWERNASKKIKDFENEPMALCEVSHGYLNVTFSVFHHLINTLEIDDFCEKFNRLKCDNWNGDYYGTSDSQCAWLEKNDFYVDDYRSAFNTYNWDSNFSQVLQGTFLRQGGHTDEYVLLQIHGGCDVRGGYTDAKLFKVNEHFLYETAYFSINENLCLDYFSGGDVSLHNNETGGDEYLGAFELDEFCKIHDGKKFIGECYF